MEKLSNIIQDILTEQRIKHTWVKVPDHKFKHFKCERCKCEKWIDDRTKNLLYKDRFDKIYYRAPDCVYPNTKLNIQTSEQIQRIKHIIYETSNLEQQFLNLLDYKIQSQDEWESVKWTVLKGIYLELHKLGEHKLIEELQYRITDGESPFKVFMEISDKSKPSPELQRLRKQLVQDFNDEDKPRNLTIDDFLNPTDER
jgi:hypothetical protein